MIQPSEAMTVSKSLGQLLAEGGAPLALGLVALWVPLGWRGVARAVTFVCLPWRRSRQGEAVHWQTAIAFACAARVTIAFTAAWSFTHTLCLMASVGFAEGPARGPAQAPAVSSGVLAILFGILLGRVLFGALADSAYRAAGRPEQHAFRGWEDLALLILLVPVLTQASAVTWHYAPIK